MEKQPHKSAHVCFHACVLVSIHYIMYTALIQAIIVVRFMLILDHILIALYACFNHSGTCSYPLSSPRPIFANLLPTHTTFTHTLCSPQKPSQVGCLDQHYVGAGPDRQSNCMSSVSNLRAIGTPLPSLCLSLLYSF